ncbi:MAG TPA: SurA N-terminal domain-containing protein [Pyrinomonadaceae bacterium]|nr:SurA N-terminal domain-containing protein [Pyrinomonadaceae bacterium]
MLTFFKRLERTRNFVLLGFSLIMVASLVLFYAPQQNTSVSNLASSSETAASVKGEVITVGEVYKQKLYFQQMMQGRPYPAKSIVNSMISSRIARVEAARLGLTASDAEVATAIRQQFTPTDGKPFDQKLYEQNAAQQAGSVAAFEQEMRDQLSAQKLRAFITAGVTVSEEEVLKDFQRSNAKFDLSYVLLSPTELAKSITPSDEDLRAYFDKNKEAYKITSVQKKIKYVFLNTAKVGEKLNISDADLQAEYDKLPADKKIGGVLGQEIVLRVPKPEQDGQILEKGNQLVAELRKNGPVVSQEAFAEIAKGQSENPTSAAQGGALRGPVRENPNNSTDPYQRLITMQPGEITDPINYQGRYFILRRGDSVPKSFEDAKKELEVSLRNRRAYGVTAELAQKVTDALKANKDVDATAKQFAGEANMAVADMIRETAYVVPGDDVPNVGVSPQFEDGISMLVNLQDVGDKIPVQNGFAIPMLADKKEPRDAEFDEVKAKLIDVVKLEKARAQSGEIANQIASGATNVGALAGLASGKGLKAEESKGFILGSPLGTGTAATTNEALEDAIYALRQGEVTKTPIQIGDAYYIVGVNSRTEANMDDFAKQRSTLMEQMAARKKGEIFSDYLASTRQKMEAAKEIVIYDAAVKKLDETDLSSTDLLNQ